MDSSACEDEASHGDAGSEAAYDAPPVSGWQLLAQGAEGRVWGLEMGGRPAVAKERFAKSYRHPRVRN